MSLAATGAQAQETTDICGRTPLIRDWILSETPAEDECGSVLVSEMAGIGASIQLISRNITSLRSGDFDGLTQLHEIDLGSNGLTELPAGIFSGLSELRHLLLSGNALETLPAGVFVGLSKLTTLRLDGNPGADFELPVHLQVTAFGSPESFAAGSVRLVMPDGAPRPVTIPVTLAGGTPTTGSLTIPTGGVESDGLRFTRGEGDFQLRTGEIALGLAAAGFSFYWGLDIVEGDRLSTITATVLRVRVFLEGALE